MECKECGSKLKEGALFCGGCGTKVEQVPVEAPEEAVEETPEETVVFCKKCGEKLNEGAKFCRKCGETAEVEVAAPKKPKSNKIRNMLVSLLAIIAVAGLVVVVGGKTGSLKRNPGFIIFTEDDEDTYAVTPGDEKYILKSSDFMDRLISKDGKKTYSIDKDENLYLQEGRKTSTRLASDVQWACITPSGDTVVYIKDTIDYLGALYIQSGKNAPERIVSEGCLITSVSVSVSDNGKYVAYTQAGDYHDKDSRRYWKFSC